LIRNSLLDVALTGGISGAVSGALISFACARQYLLLFVRGLVLNGMDMVVQLAFELVKVCYRFLD
jgi:hypothetical protein